MSINNFNIRVYGLCFEDGKILVTDEFRLGILMTKFPGGALEFGEGTLDCLKREFMEELDAEIDIKSHYYTTDFFQPTTLLPFDFQLINVYYLVHLRRPLKFRTTDIRFDFAKLTDGAQCFRWMPLKELTEDEMTFPIDKFVVRKIMAERSGNN